VLWGPVPDACIEATLLPEDACRLDASETSIYSNATSRHLTRKKWLKFSQVSSFAVFFHHH
jgi:hypothetical protein